jgi:hypothetical protein
MDLEFDLEHRVLYWIDRGNPPRGNTVNRAPIDARPQAPEIVLTYLMEGIGIVLDVPGDRMFVDRLPAPYIPPTRRIAIFSMRRAVSTTALTIAGHVG